MRSIPPRIVDLSVLLAAVGLLCLPASERVRQRVRVAQLDETGCRQVVGGDPCYDDGTSQCPGTPGGCDDSLDCVAVTQNNVTTVYCDSDQDGNPNNPTAYVNLQDEYASASGGNPQGTMETETWEPIYCYEIDICGTTCFQDVNNGFWWCTDNGSGGDGPLIYPTTATGQNCQNGQPVGE